MPTSSQKEPLTNARPGSGHGRDPLYQTQNNITSTMKFDNLMGGGPSNSEGFASKYGQDLHRVGGSQLDKKGNSPSKPPRSDLYRPSSIQDGQKEDQFAPSTFANGGGQQNTGASTRYTFTPTANRSTSEMGTLQNDGRPPHSFKAGEFQSAMGAGLTNSGSYTYQ